MGGRSASAWDRAEPTFLFFGRQVGDYLVGARRLVEQVGVGAHVHLGDVEVGQVISYDDYYGIVANTAR